MMKSVLCELAESFPLLAARILQRDEFLRKNFREETVTDLLMSSLVPLKQFGIKVDFPSEQMTGGDMEWIFVDPLSLGGGTYLRILLQAKRAKHASLSNPEKNYWYYAELDHGDPKGRQAKTLVQYASAPPDGLKTCPMYIFYHPEKALRASEAGKPAIEGVNLVFADLVELAVRGGCSRGAKKVEHWRRDFLPLSILLCWDNVPPVFNYLTREMPLLLAMRERFEFHPELVAERLSVARAKYADYQNKLVDVRPIEAAIGIPDDLQRAIRGETSEDDRKKLKRPRVMFISQLGGIKLK